MEGGVQLTQDVMFELWQTSKWKKYTLWGNYLICMIESRSRIFRGGSGYGYRPKDGRGEKAGNWGVRGKEAPYIPRFGREAPAPGVDARGAGPVAQHGTKSRPLILLTPERISARPLRVAVRCQSFPAPKPHSNS